MEHAKRMVLVDEKMLEYQPMLQHFQTKQDLSWKRPTEQSVKSSLSKAMKTVLADPTEPEDVKAKRHRQHLTRFLQTKRKLVEEPPVGDIKADDLIDFGPTVDELLDIKPTRRRRRRRAERADGQRKNPNVTRISSGIVGEIWNRDITRRACPARTAASAHLPGTAGRPLARSGDGWKNKIPIRCKN
jgi:hypothetical protein